MVINRFDKWFYVPLEQLLFCWIRNNVTSVTIYLYHILILIELRKKNIIGKTSGLGESHGPLRPFPENTPD